MLDDGAHLGALGGARRPQDRHHRRAAADMINVHRGKAAFIVMGIPERELLAAMRGAESVVDVENFQRAGLHGGAELIEQRRRKPRRLGLARCILQPADGRLRGKRGAALRAASDRHFHQRIVAQPVEVVGIFMPAGDRGGARHHQLEHRVADAAGVAPIGHRRGQPPADTKLALGFAQQQQAGVGGLVAAGKIHCEFLAVDGWQVEGKQCIVGHGGCGGGLIREATCPNHNLSK